MGGAACAKIILCGPPVAQQMTQLADFAARYLRGELKDVALDEYHVGHALESIERAEKHTAEAMGHMVKALGGY